MNFLSKYKIRATNLTKLFLSVFIYISLLTPLGALIAADETLPATTLPDIVVTADADTPCSWNSEGEDGGKYCLLAPLGNLIGKDGKIDIKGGGISLYLDGMYKAGIAIATGLALLMIIMGGLQYVSTDAISGKSEGKARIQQALLGLILALMSYLILDQLNPAFLRNDAELNQEIVLKTINKPTFEVVKEPVRPTSTTPYVDQLIGNAINPNIYSYTGTSGFRSTNFPNMEWQAYTTQLVRNSRLPSITPTDSATFFPNGQPTVEAWVGLIAGIVEKESSFKPRTTYPEGAPLFYNSVGLMQLSTPDAEAKRRGYTEEDLKNPLKNLEVGVEILQRQLLKDNCIRCFVILKDKNGKEYKSWRGATAYWSTLR